MAALKNGILPAAVYNSLPHIRDRYDVPKDNSPDIEDLKRLLSKHGLSSRVRIKLIHRHFRLQEGEVFVARDIQVPDHGTINIMQPLIASEHPSLYGHHYYVDDEGNLSAYEYMEAPGPDISGHQAFIEEFCALVRERNLQFKLGLSLRREEGSISTNELEYPAKRVCIDVPAEIPLPYSTTSFDTRTEFQRDWPTDAERLEVDGDPGAMGPQDTKSCMHCSHHKHTDRPHDDDGLSDCATISDGDEMDDLDGLYVIEGLPRCIELAGSKVDQSSGLYEIVSHMVDYV